MQHYNNPNHIYTPLLKSYPFISGIARKQLINLYTLKKFRKYYLRELTRGLTKNPSNLNSKFFLVCIPRSGSMLLGSSLGSNPHINWVGETYQFSCFKPNLLAEGMASEKRAKNFGAKLFLSEMNTDDKFVTDYIRVLERMNDMGWKFISLVRENSLNQALSYYKFIRGGSGYQLKGEKNIVKDKMKIDTNELLKIINWCKSFKEIQPKMMNSLNHYQVGYEKDLLNPGSRQETINKIFDFLEIPITKTQTQHIKQGSSKLEDRIENYDEFLSFIQFHGYEHYLT